MTECPKLLKYFITNRIPLQEKRAFKPCRMATFAASMTMSGNGFVDLLKADADFFDKDICPCSFRDLSIIEEEGSGDDNDNIPLELLNEVGA